MTRSPASRRSLIGAMTVVTVGAALVLTSCGFIVPIKPQPMAQVHVTVITPVTTLPKEFTPVQGVPTTTTIVPTPPTPGGKPTKADVGPNDLIVPFGSDPAKLSSYCRDAYALALAGRKVDTTTYTDPRDLGRKLGMMASGFRRLLTYGQIPNRSKLRAVVADLDATVAEIDRDPLTSGDLETFLAFGRRSGPTIEELLKYTDRICN